MEKETIIQTVEQVFAAADLHDWQKIQNNMDHQVFLDYSSLSGIPAATIASKQIIESWKDFLPRFDRTHHQLADFQVTEKKTTATVDCSGEADHFLNDEVWTVAGDYTIELVKSTSGWIITGLVFYLSNQSGNTDLPALAIKRGNN